MNREPKFGRGRRALTLVILSALVALVAPAQLASAAPQTTNNDPSAPIVLAAPADNPIDVVGDAVQNVGGAVAGSGDVLSTVGDALTQAGLGGSGWVLSAIGNTSKVVGKTVSGCGQAATEGINWNFFLACNPVALAATTADALFTSVTYAIIKQVNNMIKTVFSWEVDWIFGSVLGGNDNANGTGQHGFAAPDLHANFFSTQMGITRQIALYLVVPIFLLALMQAIMKGSLFFLLRATVIMLPVSIVGTAVIVEMSYQLLRVSDDISTTIASTSMDNTHEWLKQMLNTYEGNNFTIFEGLWFIVGILAIFVIIAELVIRELGIYMAVFFMPLAFAALVWPATAKFARRLVELLIGLIFSKVFIVAALALGMAALGHAQGAAEAGGTQIGIGNVATQLGAITGINEVPKANPLEGLQGLTAAVAIFFMAAFSGVKIMEIAPGASAAVEGRMMSPGNIMGKGHVANLVSGTALKMAKNRRDNITPKAPQPQRASTKAPTAVLTPPPGGGGGSTSGGGGSGSPSRGSGYPGDGGHYPAPPAAPAKNSPKAPTTPGSSKNNIRNARNRSSNNSQSPLSRRPPKRT